MDRSTLTPDEITAELAALDAGWLYASDSLRRTVQCPSFLTAVELITRLAPIAERLDHHPDIHLSWRTVELTLSTHSSGGVTSLDVMLARELDPLIASLTDTPT